MSVRLTCARGHQWRLRSVAELTGGATILACPVCGPVSEVHLAEERPSDAAPTPTPRSDAAQMRAPGAVRHAAPTQIAGYDVLRELGRGGMGVVYQARQQSLNPAPALKMSLPRGAPPPADPD